MKTRVLLIVGLALIFTQASADHATGARFSSEHGRTIRVMIDGHYVNRTPGHNIIVNGRSGHHAVQVEVFNGGGHVKQVVRERVYFRNGYRSEYILVGGNGHYSALRKVREVRIQPVRYEERGRDYGYRNSKVIAEWEVNRFVKDLRRVGFDDDRLEIAKDFIKGRKLYAEDVAFIMSELRFEDNRLRFAKSAYKKTLDTENYGFVFDKLRFRSSQDKLDNYIFKVENENNHHNKQCNKHCNKHGRH